jgi:hypothetical protein
VQRIERDDGAARNAKFRQKRLRRRDLVGLLGDIDMGEHKRRVGGERTQHLGRGTVAEFVEAAAQRLAVKGYAVLAWRMPSDDGRRPGGKRFLSRRDRAL